MIPAKRDNVSVAPRVTQTGTVLADFVSTNAAGRFSQRQQLSTKLSPNSLATNLCQVRMEHFADHVPACERRTSSSMLPYRPSIIRDLSVAIRHTFSFFTPPFTLKRLFEAGMILLVAPLYLALVGFQHAYWAALEKYEWNWTHSRAIVTLPANSGPIPHPSWHSFGALVVGLFWGAAFFVIGMVPYYLLARFQ